MKKESGKPIGEGEVVLTSADHLVLESYSGLMDGLENYLGEGFEIVLHSLEDFEHSVVKIVNGHHTGRKAGAPITDLALAMLDRIGGQESDSHIAYFTKNKKGEPLKACTIAIRGQEGRIIGLLCVNFYLNTPISQMLMGFCPPDNNNMLFETFGDSATELVEQAVARARTVVMGNPSIAASLKNREIVAQLQEQGIFRIKNAVELTAELMGISKNTVYLHLRHMDR